MGIGVIVSAKFFQLTYKKRKYRYFVFLSALLLLLSCFSVRAQEVKKSTRVEKIGDKKYYIHTVEAGQTLSSIAKAYVLSVNDLVIENPTAIDGIKPGQELHIPYLKSLKSSYESNKSLTHKTEAGQTLYSISKLYGVSIEELKTLNPELKDGLKAGQVLKIPAASKEVVVAEKTEKAVAEQPR